MRTYNGINVPPLIRTDRIISAFENAIDYDKVEYYTNTMKAYMLSHEFPAILGYPRVIDDDDIGLSFLTGEDVTDEHIGMIVWMVTDGHHRVLSAIEAELPHLEVELDRSTITSEKDM